MPKGNRSARRGHAPKFPAELLRRHLVQVRFTGVERARVVAAVDRANADGGAWTVSSWIRHLALDGAGE